MPVSLFRSVGFKPHLDATSGMPVSLATVSQRWHPGEGLFTPFRSEPWMRCAQPRLASRPWLVKMPWEAVPGFRGDHSGPSVLRGTGDCGLQGPSESLF